MGDYITKTGTPFKKQIRPPLLESIARQRSDLRTCIGVCGALAFAGGIDNGGGRGLVCGDEAAAVAAAADALPRHAFDTLMESPGQISCCVSHGIGTCMNSGVWVLCSRLSRL